METHLAVRGLERMKLLNCATGSPPSRNLNRDDSRHRWVQKCSKKFLQPEAMKTPGEPCRDQDSNLGCTNHEKY